MGGVAILPKFGHSHISSYHMNEGHSALLTLALIEHRLEGRTLLVRHGRRPPRDSAQVCVYDAHACSGRPGPVFERPGSAGFGERRSRCLEHTGACSGRSLNMTYLALFGSRYINGVAMQHGEVSRGMFPHYPIRAITNGVHADTWTRPYSGTL